MLFLNEIIPDIKKTCICIKQCHISHEFFIMENIFSNTIMLVIATCNRFIIGILTIIKIYFIFFSIFGLIW